MVRRLAALVMAALLLAVVPGCGDDDDSAASTTTTTTSTTTTSTTTTSTTTTTTEPAVECDADETLAVVADAVERAGLAPVVGEWSTDLDGSPFAERTTDPDTYAERLGFDCGLIGAEAVDGGERLVIAAWTGPRMGFVIQTNETPATPYVRDATVTVFVDSTRGEFLDGEGRSLWAGTFDSGETFVVRHVDYSLGAVAKSWPADFPEFQPEPVNVPSEQHGIDALEAANMRLVGIAQPPEFGSEEGYVSFLSPSGQISVADIGPTGWFDPMQPRYFTGDTRFETIEGAQVRITDPKPDDNLGFTLGAEVAFACDDFVWILEPPGNGTVDEMLDSTAAILATEECQAG